MMPLQATLDELMGEMDDALQHDLRRTAETHPEKFRDLRRSFEAFHVANPGVYSALLVLARQAKAHGHEHIGIATLWEIIRWDVLMGSTKTTDGYKLNNNHRAFYARLLMEREPELDGMFETRRQRAVS